ncbi:MAG TPA: aspartyl protease family protein [Candidatus Angelobacter sp.]
MHYNRLMLRLLFLLLVGPALYAQTSSADALTSARALFKQGKFQDAAGAYRAIVNKDPSSALAYSGLVQSYLKADGISAADEASDQALKALPQSALAHAMRGAVYFREGLLAEAENQYRAALKQDEKCERAWLGMGKIFAAVSRQDQARESFTKAHTLDPDDGDAWYHWAVLLPFPQSVTELEKHLAEFRSSAEEERREREFIDLLKGIGNREIWVASGSIDQAEIKLDLMAPRPGVVLGLGLHVKFNNSSSAMLLLDTGTTWITIPHKLAEKIGAKKISDYGIEGVGDTGPAAGYFAWVDKITVGDVEFHDCVVHVSAGNNLNGADGLAGTNIFAKYLVTINFPEHKLRLGPLAEATSSSGETLVHPFDSKSNAQVFEFGHVLLLPARVNRSPIGLFVLDTGANSSSTTPEFARMAGKLHQVREPIRGVSGVVNQVFVLDDAALQFSSVSESVHSLPAFDSRSLSRQLGTVVSGFIGFSSLNRAKVSINYRDGWVSLSEK